MLNIPQPDMAYGEYGWHMMNISQSVMRYTATILIMDGVWWTCQPNMIYSENM